MPSHPFLAPAPIQLLWEQSEPTQMHTKHVQEWARKDRTSTAPAQTTTKVHNKVLLFVPALGNPHP